MRDQVHWPQPDPFLTVAPTPQYYLCEMGTPKEIAVTHG